MPRKTGLLTLKKRPAFLAIAATRKKWVAPGLILQIGPATTSPAQTLRPCFGLTASKKVTTTGNKDVITLEHMKQ
ncbi:MAG: hypothetical protein HGA90_07625, partial [Alphaproteobacteria bacterium]|nr:hypothetical protein [Alphaproteobacteria bacterium]